MWTALAKALGVDTIVVYLVAGLIGAGALGGAYWCITDGAYDRGVAATEAKYAERDRKTLEALNLAERAARSKEQALTDQIAKSKQDEANAQAALSAARGRIADLLRQRPARPASVPGATATPAAGETVAGCTGRQLYRDDGEFLKRESERADTIRLALKQCYTQYDAARGATQ